MLAGRTQTTPLNVALRYLVSGLLVVLMALPVLGATDLPTITAATLRYGTANWELQLIRERGLDRKHGFELAVREVASPSAASVALQGGAADLAVQDWLWALRQRQQGRDFRFAPFSTSLGALVVPIDHPGTGLSSLKGQTLGVAGGSQDKSWRLLGALMDRSTEPGLADSISPKFAAPPLLNKLLEKGDIDGALTYWHYAARLDSSRFRVLMKVEDILGQLGIPEPVPMLGWCFDDDLTRSPGTDLPPLAARFLAASREAKRVLATDPDAWDSVRPLMKTHSDQVFKALQAGFIAGIPAPLDSTMAAHILQVAELYWGGGERPEGDLRDVFWPVVSGP